MHQISAATALAGYGILEAETDDSDRYPHFQETQWNIGFATILSVKGLKTL